MRKISFIILATALPWLIIYFMGCKPAPAPTTEEASAPLAIDVPLNPVDGKEAITSADINDNGPGQGPHGVVAAIGGHAPIAAGFGPTVVPFPLPDPGTGGGSQGALKPVRLNHDDDDEDDPICGNREVEEGEECDDGNQDNEDACSNDCQINDDDCSSVKTGESAYIFCLDFLPWLDAQTACTNFGPFNLVSINGPSENALVLDMISGDEPDDDEGSDSWIGLNDLAVEGTFVWVDGDPVSYTNWHPGEPNNLDTEDCVEMYVTNDPGTWNNLTCDDSLSFVCEADLEDEDDSLKK